MRAPPEWSSSVRYAVGAATGAVWAVLLVALIGLHVKPVAFFLASALLAGPVLGRLARGPLDLLLILLASLLTSLAVVFALAAVFSARPVSEIEHVVLLIQVLLNWVPTWAAAYLIAGGLRYRARRARRAPTDKP